MVSNTALPDDLRGVIQQAWLAAPVHALLSPCSVDEKYQRMYASFLRAALGDATNPHQLTAIWEQTRLQEGNSEGIAHRRANIEEVIVQTSAPPANCSSASVEGRARCLRGDLVDTFLKESPGEGITCGPARRLGFAVQTQAYYWQAITHLREVLRTPVFDVTDPHFKYAAVCLRDAFKTKRGKSPSCDKSIHGMWTEDYSPYLALAVIRTEQSAADRSKNPR